MKSREELRNDYEEALFAIIMDDIMELEGRAFVEERERLAASDEFKVPDDVNERCLELIEQTLEEKKALGKKRTIRKVWRTILFAALISCLCFTTAYASVPAVKQATNNLINSFSDICTRIVLRDTVIDVEEGRYVIAGIPQNLAVVEEGNGDGTKWYVYSDEKSTIIVEIDFACLSNEQFVDMEDADFVENVGHDEFKGIVVAKDNRVHMVLQDTERGNMIQIVGQNVDLECVMNIMKGINYLK